MASSTSTQKIGFIGLGLMGAPMAMNVLKAGYELTVFNRSPGKTAALESAGAAVASSVASLTESHAIIIMMLTNSKACEAVIEQMGPSLKGKTLLNTSTISQVHAEAVAAKVAGLGGSYLECPVLGTTPAAVAGSLGVLAGGSEELFKEVEGLLSTMGTPTYVGAMGQAAVYKLGVNQLLLAEAAALSFSLALVEKAGGDPSKFAEVIKGNKVSSPFMNTITPGLLGRRYPAMFPTRLALKDALLMQAEGQRLGVSTEGVDSTVTLLKAADEAGFGDDNFTSFHEIVNPKKSEDEEKASAP